MGRVVRPAPAWTLAPRDVDDSSVSVRMRDMCSGLSADCRLQGLIIPECLLSSAQIWWHN